MSSLKPTTRYTRVRLAMSVTSISLLISGVFFLLAAKTLPNDWEDAQERNEGLAKAET